ncbi:hypothetical protein CSKR_114099 [Clonorchis sinensis]|uniref:Uncharacterized protein n=1 Tax=Clonorchis sinensis TaxID=79923 RepID=A0A419PW85_CLOSI|nr:hypothetical protein CSKR_114099 [Clonorchis sinensis]
MDIRACMLSLFITHYTTEGARWPKLLEREFTDRRVRGSNPTSASRLPLSRLGQPGSIPALVQPSDGTAVRHRKATFVQFGFKQNIRLTETQGLRLPDEPQEERNRPWAIEEFSSTLRTRYGCTFLVVIIILDSMTSVLNTDASLPYNHDLFESLIVKKRIKLTIISPRCPHLQTRIQAIWIETDNKNATEIGWHPYLAVSPTRRSGVHAIPNLEGE